MDSNTSIVRHRFSTVNYGEHLVDLADNAAGDLIMDCWSCGRKIPDTATYCPYCEAHAEEELSVDDEAAVQKVLAEMSPDTMNVLREVFEDSKSGDEFVHRVLVGDCPNCGSSITADCEDHPEIGHAYYARCLECDYLWCMFCGETIDPHRPFDHECPDWTEIDVDEEAWDDAD
jgi:predicted RNA-binding Zn-ribbon protein involved in translation (DUF1610 family)